MSQNSTNNDNTNNDNDDSTNDNESAFELRDSREAMIAAAAFEEDLVNSFKVIELKSFCARRRIEESLNSTKADIITVIISDNIRRKSRDQEESLLDRQRTIMPLETHVSASESSAVSTLSSHIPIINASVFQSQHPVSGPPVVSMLSSQIPMTNASNVFLSEQPSISNISNGMSYANITRNYIPNQTTTATSYYQTLPSYQYFSSANANVNNFELNRTGSNQTQNINPYLITNPSYVAIPDLSKFIETYDGSDDQNATRWLERLERILVSHRVNPEEWILVVEKYLKNNARRWHDSIRRSFIQ